MAGRSSALASRTRIGCMVCTPRVLLASFHHCQHASTIVDRDQNDPTPLIARRLRDERARRGWTLDDLARRAGVSKAMLSKLERSEASPTAALLGRISGALGMTLSTLLAADHEPGARLVRRDDQPTWRDPASGYLRRQVSPLSDLPVHL